MPNDAAPAEVKPADNAQPQASPPPAPAPEAAKTILGDAPPPAPEVKAPEGDKAPEPKKEGEAAKPKEGGDKPGVPEKYELKLPENSLLDPSRLEKIAAVAKERGLSNEAAQALVDHESQAVADFQKAQLEGLKKTSEKWVEELKADKEFGGEAFSKTAEAAKRVVARFGDQQFREALESTGLGNHPALVRVFARIGKAMSEDQFVQPGAAPASPMRIEDRFYGKQE